MVYQLTKRDIFRIVNLYIGVSGGYLGDFTYRTHAEFYSLYCDLEIDPNEISGTTRERFIEILSNQNSKQQAQIIKGIIERFPIDDDNKPKSRTAKLRDELLEIASRLELSQGVPFVSLSSASDVVHKALKDSEILLESSGASNVIDRLFTAMQGYLEFILDEEGIVYPTNGNITTLFKILKENHPAFQHTGHRAHDIKKIIRIIAAIIDALQPLRNKASLSHPNILLETPEAMLVVNATKTLLHYVDDKIQEWND